MFITLIEWTGLPLFALVMCLWHDTSSQAAFEKALYDQKREEDYNLHMLDEERQKRSAARKAYFWVIVGFAVLNVIGKVARMCI